MSGSFLILYAGIAIGLIISLDGLIGCLGGMFGSMLLIKIYVALSVVFGIVEIAVIMAVYVEKEEIPSILNSTWNQINDEARYTIQESLKCCGIDSYTEYGSDYAEFPDSCFTVSKIFGTVIVKQESTLYTTSCLSAMQTWLKENMAIWIAVLISIAIIQMVSGMLSCQVHARLHDVVRVSPINKVKKEASQTEIQKKHELNNLEAAKEDRNIDGASCNSSSTIENESNKRSKIGIAAVIDIDEDNVNDDKGDDKSLNEKQFQYKSEPRLNEADLNETLYLKEYHFTEDNELTSEKDINIINEGYEVQKNDVDRSNANGGDMSQESDEEAREDQSKENNSKDEVVKRYDEFVGNNIEMNEHDDDKKNDNIKNGDMSNFDGENGDQIREDNSGSDVKKRNEYIVDKHIDEAARKNTEENKNVDRISTQNMTENIDYKQTDNDQNLNNYQSVKNDIELGNGDTVDAVNNTETHDDCKENNDKSKLIKESSMTSNH